jgi:hypothetical protein
MSRKTATVTLEIAFHPAFELSPGAWDWQQLFRQWGGDELADRLVSAVPAAAEPPESDDDEEWIHNELGPAFPKFARWSWAEMARGPVGGGRHKYLTWFRQWRQDQGLWSPQHKMIDQRIEWAIDQIEQ